MRKCLLRIVSIVLAVALLACAAPFAAAAELETDRCPDLSGVMADAQRRQFVEMMVGYYLRHDPAVRRTLREGYSAVFFFEGCSDNMNDPELKDLSYYRVSAVCLAIRLNASGVPALVYFNDACSTLPDRPLDFAPRKEEVPADVGPATVFDGTYELYSVRHGGNYEALHVRTSYEDATVPAIYMTPHGYTRVQATMINIHTRTGNHILKNSMWSEGCILVGDGEFEKFSELIQASYYAIYPYFALGVPVGTVTINRQMLKEEMYTLYGEYDPVDLLLAESRRALPKKYLEKCALADPLPEETVLWASRDTQLMTLPCSNETDARSIPVGVVPEGTELTVLDCIRNTRGALWYTVEQEGRRYYIYSGDTRAPSDLEQLWRQITE